jgi:hypothetical protein
MLMDMLQPVLTWKVAKIVHIPGVKTPTGSSFKKEEPDSTGCNPIV